MSLQDPSAFVFFIWRFIWGSAYQTEFAGPCVHLGLTSPDTWVIKVVASFWGLKTGLSLIPDECNSAVMLIDYKWNNLLQATSCLKRDSAAYLAVVAGHADFFLSSQPRCPGRAVHQSHCSCCNSTEEDFFSFLFFFFFEVEVHSGCSFCLCEPSKAPYWKSLVLLVNNRGKFKNVCCWLTWELVVGVEMSTLKFAAPKWSAWTR